jgi:hypothetical protein
MELSEMQSIGNVLSMGIRDYLIQKDRHSETYVVLERMPPDNPRLPQLIKRIAVVEHVTEHDEDKWLISTPVNRQPFASYVTLHQTLCAVIASKDGIIKWDTEGEATIRQMRSAFGLEDDDKPRRFAPITLDVESEGIKPSKWETQAHRGSDR